MADIRSIIFEKINNKYSYRKYGTFDVIIMNKNGYINATQLCAGALNSKGEPKRIRNWIANKKTDQLIEAVCAISGISETEIMIEITTGSDKFLELRGTYAHPQLIPHIASWASVDFAIKVSDIIKEFFIKEALKEKELIIEKQHGTINTQKEKLNIYRVKLEKSNTKADNLLKQNNVLIKENKKLMSMRNKSDSEEDTESLLVIIDNSMEGHYTYAAIQASVESKSRKIKDHKKTCRKARVVAVIEASDTASELWKNIISHLTEGDDAIIGSYYKLTGRRESDDKHYFDISDNVTEEDMIEAFEKVNSE